LKTSDRDSRANVTEMANITWLRDNYPEYGYILLSGDQSDKGDPRNISVADNLPD